MGIQGVSSQLRLEVLGPVRVEQQDRPVAIPGRQGLLLLVLLATEAGRVVDRDRLIEGLWDGSPPASARNALQGLVAGLRRVLGREAVETHGTGYRLAVDVEVDTDEVAEDVRVAADLILGGAHAEAASMLVKVIGRWRGPPFADLPASPRLVAERARLEEIRLQAEELWVQALVGAGRADRAVVELERMVRAHPTREQRRALQMRALLRCDRRGDALAAYDLARRWLADELGVDPGEELQRAHREVLLADGALTPDPHDVLAPIAAPTHRSVERRLPRPGTTYGREADLTRLLGVMAEEPLVTLIGPGGVGKTHLATAAGHRVKAGTEPQVEVEEVHLIPLADAASAADAPAVACTALGLGVPSDATSALVEGLSGRSALLIWDNLEHVIEARELLAGLLEELPEIRHLVTSRVPLRLHREARVPLHPLTAGDGSSARLFASRARRLDPTWKLAEGDTDHLDRVLAGCGGLPLAIELAAARLNIFALPELSAALEQSADVLTTRTVDRPSRQRDMAANVGWSLDLLEPATADRLSALAVFRGGFDLTSATAVWQVDAATARTTIETLVDSSLLIRSRSWDDHTRFAVHEPVRDALMGRASPDAVADVTSRHALHYVDRFGHEGPNRFLCSGTDLMQEVAVEAPNVRQAIRHLLAAGDGARAVRLLVGVFDLWFQQGPRVELNQWVEDMCEIADLPRTAKMDCDLMLAQILFNSPEGFRLLQSVREEALTRGDATRAAWAANHESFFSCIAWAEAAPLRHHRESGTEWEAERRQQAEEKSARASVLAAACPGDPALQASEAFRALTEAVVLDLDCDHHQLYTTALAQAGRLGFPGVVLGVHNNYCEFLLWRRQFGDAYRISAAGIADDRQVVHHTYAALLSQHGLAALALGRDAEGLAILGRALERVLAAIREAQADDVILRIAAGLDHAHAALAGEALGIATGPVELHFVRDRLDVLRTALGDDLEAAVQRGREAVRRYGFRGAGRRWLAALREVGALPAVG